MTTHRVDSNGLQGFKPYPEYKDSGVEWLGEILAHWTTKRVKNIARFVTSGSRGWAKYYSDEGPLFLRIGNLNSGSIDLHLGDVQFVRPPRGAEGERTRVRADDVLISITALIGAVGVVPSGIPEAFVNQHLALVRPLHQCVYSRWLGYCVLSRVGQEQLLAELYGGTKDGLGLEDIRSLMVLLPPLDEQWWIVEFLDEEGERIEALIAKIGEAIDRLKEYRTALISATVTGKIDVRGEDEEKDGRLAV
jgi:type I restriction enzyme S subunit